MSLTEVNILALWDSEFTVSKDLAAALIVERFPEFAPATIELLGEGWDNVAYQVNSDFIFRFPRRAIAVELIELEYRALSHIATEVSLPIPVPLFFGQPTEDYPWPFSGYRKLVGSTGCSVDLNESERIALAKPLAQFLASLHSVSEVVTSKLNLPGDKIGRLDLAKRTPVLKENLNKISKLGLGIDIKKLLSIVDAVNISIKPEFGTLVHGDLYSRHLIFDEGRNLSGVIDWGDLHLGDRAVDLAIAHSFLPSVAHPAFKAAYGMEISDQIWKLAQFRALSHSCYVALYSHDIRDRNLLNESTKSLHFLSREE
jgi:aminoglycoside phosphotransferase (APT) family kinase protein